MIKIGLTGGIGSGKSTVSKMLLEKSIPIIDADIVSKDVLIKYPEILEKIRIEFGEAFFDWKNEFRRREFGNHIFRFPNKRLKYEKIIIPYIKNEISQLFDSYESKGAPLVVLDAPILIETNLNIEMDYIVVVWTDSNTQLQRVKLRDNLSKSDAINRINSQISLDLKLNYANIVINNNSTIINTKTQIEQLVNFLNEITL